MVQSILEQLGGEPALRKLVNRFYDLIETHPRGANILRLHFRGHGVSHVREEQYSFLSGFLGGRRYYFENHGHHDVKLMHAHVPITAVDAEDWLALMDQAIDDCGLVGPHVERMRATFRRVAMILVNDLNEWGLPAAPAPRGRAPAGG
ncbi:MAG: group II truncated hemoglobin [Proteobacteria bacterium]|nr:group II truncated hemoglobin [Pseudomonadota bacterium]MBS0572368.1 group II truncated hemoglobin [Pseudomonadota bacterium]